MSGLCACCGVVPVTYSIWCDGCIDHLGDEWFVGPEFWRLNGSGCPVYNAYACCEPYPWEVAA